MLDLVLCVCTEYIEKCVTIITRIIRPITKLNSIYVSTIYKGKKKKKTPQKSMIITMLTPLDWHHFWFWDVYECWS
jgi:hypothetical protein